MLATGYPELQTRSARGRSRFVASYVASIIGRELDDVANVRNIVDTGLLAYLIGANERCTAATPERSSRDSLRWSCCARPTGPRSRCSYSTTVTSSSARST